MKIAFLIKGIHPNAGQTYDLAEIIKYLLSSHSDWSISVFTNEVYYPIVEGMNDPRVSIIKIDEYYKYMLFKEKLATKLKEYDVLYVKGNYPYLFPAKKSGRPTILVVHQKDSAKLFNGVVPKLKIIATNLLTGRALKKADTVITITDELGSFYEKRFGIKIRVIPDLTSDVFFSSPQRKDPVRSQEIRLLTVGNWDGPNGRKRHDVLLSYFAYAIKALPNLHISMVGLSNDNLKELGKVCNDLQLNNYVTLKGYLGEKELVEEFINSHIYVTATTYEGFYRQVVEGFATGMPALVYDSRKIIKEPSGCASANHVLKSGAGELFTDSGSFTSAIVKILDNYSEYSGKARIYAKIFSREVVGLKTERLLESMASE
jgi:glycosyltransferase involved in cell wall biosynthesis